MSFFTECPWLWSETDHRVRCQMYKFSCCSKLVIHSWSLCHCTGVMRHRSAGNVCAGAAVGALCTHLATRSPHVIHACLDIDDQGLSSSSSRGPIVEEKYNSGGFIHHSSQLCFMLFSMQQVSCKMSCWSCCINFWFLHVELMHSVLACMSGEVSDVQAVHWAEAQEASGC